MKQRILALLMILMTEYIASVICPLAPRNQWYYPIASVFNIMTLSFLLSFIPTKLIVDLVKLTAIQFCLQGLGWALYALHFHPTALIYNWSIRIIVLVTFLRLFIVGKHDGLIEPPTWISLFRIGHYMGRKQSQRGH